jgi:DNA-binding transcriptional ArsR family regulator
MMLTDKELEQRIAALGLDESSIPCANLLYAPPVAARAAQGAQRDLRRRAARRKRALFAAQRAGFLRLPLSEAMRLVHGHDEAARQAQDLWGAALRDAVEDAHKRGLVLRDERDRRVAEEALWLLLAWPHGACSGSALSLVLALLRLHAETGKTAFDPSLYQLGELAGLGGASASGTHASTVRKAIEKAERLGYVKVTSRDTVQHVYLRQGRARALHDASRAARELFLNRRALTALREAAQSSTHLFLSSLVDAQMSVVLRELRVQHLLHPVWETTRTEGQAGLGRTACRVYYALAVLGGATAADLATALRLSKRTVQATLKKLRAAGIVEERERVYVALPFDYDQLAEELGVAGRAETRARANEIRREHFRAAVGVAAPASTHDDEEAL